MKPTPPRYRAGDAAGPQRQLLRLALLLGLAGSAAVQPQGAAAAAVEPASAYSAASGYLQPQISTGSEDPYVNRCALNPLDDVAKLRQDPPYVEAYHSGASGNSAWAPTTGRGLVHRQGIQRRRDGASNYFLVSNSTEDGVRPGLELVALKTGDWHYEALGQTATPYTYPAAGDHVLRYLAFPTPYYDHAGGFQVSGGFAIVPYEHSDDAYYAGFLVADLRTPAAPGWIGSAMRQRGSRTNAGAAAMTRLNDGRFLALVFGDDAEDVEVFLSTRASLPGTAADSSWNSVAAAATPPGFEAYQNLQLVTACDGRLFVAGTHKNGASEDWLDLWQLRFSYTLSPSFSKVANRHLKCSSATTASRRYCDFDAGAGVYVSQSGSLLLYGIEHYNDAYPFDGSAVKVREFSR